MKRRRYLADVSLPNVDSFPRLDYGTWAEIVVTSFSRKSGVPKSICKEILLKRKEGGRSIKELYDRGMHTETAAKLLWCQYGGPSASKTSCE